MPKSTRPTAVYGNRLLANLSKSLPTKEYGRLLSLMEEVSLEQHEILIDPGEAIKYVYFPANVMISLVSLMEEDQYVETGAVGKHGMLGMPLILGADTTPMRSVVQIPGKAMRMEGGRFKAELERNTKFREVLSLYVHVQLLEISQTAACNKLHPANGRLARWLLISSDCVDSHELPLTHDFLATMLGMRRAGVTEAAGDLKGRGLIDYHRGKVTILDRERLEDTACECYDVVKREVERLYAQ